MRKIGRQCASPLRVDRRAELAGILLALASIAVICTTPAQANVGYELDASNPSRALGGAPKGLAVDQASQDIYVAIVSTNPNAGIPGHIERFNSNLSADGTFAPGGGFYTGVAVNPLTQGFFGAQMEIGSPLGNLGTPKLDRFSSAGVLAGSSALGFTDSLPPIATDSAGNVFFPNVNTHSVQVFDSSGVLQEEISCGGCSGGSFGKPASVALTSSDDLYVADADPDRVVKLTLSAGSYSYASTLQSGRGAGAVAVDPATGDVLVGDMPGAKDFHIVAYDSSGAQFDDFGAGIFRDVNGPYGSLSAYQIAVNATTHRLYVGEQDKFFVFEKATIDPPSATANSATNTGQVAATLNASVNANGHAVLECEFEYTDETDFQANGFANAASLPCSGKPDGSVSTPLGATVSSLDPGTLYRFRITATSNAGTVNSGSKTFETLPEVPPTVTTESPQAVGQSTATLKGTVNPHGGAVSDCHFEFGTSASYGSNAPCAVLPGAVTSDIAQMREISALSPSTAYHYRLVVTTNAGTDAGDDVEFMTASAPVGSNEPPSSAPPQTAPPAPSPPSATPPTPRCRAGFRRQRVGGKPRCVKICRRGFRRRLVNGKVSCVKRRSDDRRRHRTAASS